MSPRISPRALGLRLLLAAGLMVLGYGIVLAHPAPLFSYELDVPRIHFHSRRTLSPALERCLAEALARVEHSGIDAPEVSFELYEAGSIAWYRFFNGPYAGAMARESELGGNIFLPKVDEQSCAVEHFDGRRASTAVIVAHEMTHRLMQQKLGVLRVWRLPWWKREGFAEFVGEADRVPLKERIAEFDAESTSPAPTYPRRLFEALIATRYLLEVRHLSFDEFVTSDESLASIWSAIRRDYPGS